MKKLLNNGQFPTVSVVIPLYNKGKYIERALHPVISQILPPLEAALANRPVLSTPLGAEGLDLVDDTDILLFENARVFIDQYQKLFDRNKYNSLIQSAKKEVLTKYSMKNFNDAMERVLIELDNKKHSI